MRSNMVKRGFEDVRHRRLPTAAGAMHGVGDGKKPFGDACTGDFDLISGHVYLHTCGQIATAGSVPFACNTVVRNSLTRS